MDKFYRSGEEKIKETEKSAEKKLSEKIRDISATLRKEGTGDIESDVTGSYTGISNKSEWPIQDADDL